MYDENIYTRPSGAVFFYDYNNSRPKNVFALYRAQAPRRRHSKRYGVQDVIVLFVGFDFFVFLIRVLKMFSRYIGRKRPMCLRTVCNGVALHRPILKQKSQC